MLVSIERERTERVALFLVCQPRQDKSLQYIFGDTLWKKCEELGNKSSGHANKGHASLLRQIKLAYITFDNSLHALYLLCSVGGTFRKLRNSIGI